MQVWKLLLVAKGLLWGVRKLRERKHFRRGIIAGALIAGVIPIAIHAPAEAAHILVKEGMRGGAVQHVQELLIKAGYLEEGGADGVAGAKTRAAIERCQTDHMLVVDGICGEATYLVLSGGVPYDPVALGIRDERSEQVSRGSGRSSSSRRRHTARTTPATGAVRRWGRPCGTASSPSIRR